MKPLPFVFAMVLLIPAGGALAHGHDAPSARVNATCCKSPACWADRHDTDEARLAIETEDRDATLMITDRVVALQLSERTLRKVRRELRNEQEDEDNPIARAVMAAVFSGVRTLLDHSVECPIRDLRDVQYRDGELVFIAENGERLFGGLDVNDRDVTQSFSEPDARRFVAEFRRAKRQLP